MKKHLINNLLFISLLVTLPLSAKNIQYVSDDLTIPMRSGTTTAHKILKFLNSGVALEVIEITDDKKHALVSPVDDASKTGWVEISLLMQQKGGREQLELEKQKNKSIKDKYAELKIELKDLKEKNSGLQSVQLKLEDKNQNLQDTLSSLRESASDPIRIADENQQLKSQLATEQEKNESLTQENTILGDQNIKQWFLIGAAVSIGSLILGLLLTRISWKKKDRWA